MVTILASFLSRFACYRAGDGGVIGNSADFYLSGFLCYIQGSYDILYI